MSYISAFLVLAEESIFRSAQLKRTQISKFLLRNETFNAHVPGERRQMNIHELSGVSACQLLCTASAVINMLLNLGQLTAGHGWQTEAVQTWILLYLSLTYTWKIGEWKMFEI